MLNKLFPSKGHLHVEGIEKQHTASDATNHALPLCDLWLEQNGGHYRTLVLSNT